MLASGNRANWMVMLTLSKRMPPWPGVTAPLTRHEYPALWPPSIRTPALHVLALSRLYLTVVLKRPIGLAGLLKYLLVGYGYATGLRMNARSRGERDGLVLTWARLKGVSTAEGGPRHVTRTSRCRR